MTVLYNAPVQNIVIEPQAVIDFGFISSYNTFSGIGLLTFGFLWLSSEFWGDCNVCDDSVTTIWYELGAQPIETENALSNLITEDGTGGLITEQENENPSGDGD